MKLIHWKTGALMILASVTQLACYNTYFVDKDELRKLESNVEQREVVEVFADCAGARAQYDGPTRERAIMLAQNDAEAPAEVPAEAPPVANDASPATAQTDVTVSSDSCVTVPVSTANALSLVRLDGGRDRVTPFNFIMSETQIVSPEYDLLLSLNEVEGAEVKQFSTWKTVATVAGVTVATVGAFVAISLLAPEGSGFSN